MKVLLFRKLFLSTFFIVSLSIYSQKYQGDLPWSAPRLIQYQENGSFPEELLLFYRGQEGDYAIFYDLDGKEALFQFRRNRFDLESEKKLIGLFPGLVYRVKGNFKGMLVYYHPILKKNFFPPELFDKTELEQEIIKEKNNKPVFILKSYESAAFDQVLY